MKLRYINPRRKRVRHQQKKQRDTMARRRMQAEKKPKYLSDGTHPVRVSYQGKTRTARARGRIAMPGVLCFDRNYEESTTFLNDLRTRLVVQVPREIQKPLRTRNQRRRNLAAFRIGGYVDFATLADISPSAALVLAAEYDVVQNISNVQMHLINYGKWNSAVKKKLREIGFLDLFNSVLSKPADPSKKVSILKFKSGEVIDPSTAEWLIEALVDMAVPPDACITDERRQTILAAAYIGIIEAMGNVRQHAYPATGNEPSQTVRRWWISGAYDRTDRRLSIILYDRGVTIPVSLPTWTYWNRIERVLKRLPIGWETSSAKNDHVAMRMAMRLGGSSTGLEYRGKGLPAMISVLADCRIGRLRVVSRHGDVTVEKGKKPEAQWRTIPLQGTLVEWTICI